MPSRQDRDRLVAAAKENPENEKRVHIWDYFFRVNPDEVGIPIRKEIAKNSNDLPTIRHKADQRTQQLQTEIRNTKEMLDRVAGETEAELLKSFENIRSRYSGRTSRRRFFGVFSMILAAFVGMGALWLYTSFGGTEENRQVFVIPAATYCCLPMILLFGLVSILLFWRARTNFLAQDQELTRERERAYQARDEREAQLRKRIQELENDIQNTQQEASSLIADTEERQDELQALLRELIQQIPWPPSVDQVNRWFCEDIESLEDAALTETGLHGRLQTVLEGTNPISIRGPARIQAPKSIPEHYRKRNEDYNKHFEASRIEQLSNGKYVDLYGLCSIQFILLADDVLASYKLLYNFITGRDVEVRTRRQHYADVVGIETNRSNREVKVNDEMSLVEGVPSLRISLTNDEKIDITYPNDHYYRVITGEHSFPISQLDYDPRIAAKHANMLVQERVNEAKQKREISRRENLF